MNQNQFHNAEGFEEDRRGVEVVGKAPDYFRKYFQLVFYALSTPGQKLPRTSLFLTGGVVRAHILATYYGDHRQKSPFDVDFIVTGLSYKEAVERVRQLPLQTPPLFWPRVSTISLQIGSFDLDITTTQSSNPLDVVMSHDITISQFFADYEGNIYDAVNGIKDLKDGIIRIKDPDKKILESPERILRAIRIAVDLGFRIEAETLRSIDLYKGLLARTPLNYELNRIMEMPFSKRIEVFWALKHLGVLMYLDLPRQLAYEIQMLIELEQELRELPVNDFVQDICVDTDESDSAGSPVFLVGGAIRDLVLRRRPKDYDFKTTIPISVLVQRLKDRGYKQTFSIHLQPKEFYINPDFPVISVLDEAGNEIELSHTATLNITHLIDQGDVTFNALGFDLVSGVLLTPAQAVKVKKLELDFIHPDPEYLEAHPLVVLNFLKQVARYPEIHIQTGTIELVRGLRDSVINFLLENDKYLYKLEAILGYLNTPFALSLLGLKSRLFELFPNVVVSDRIKSKYPYVLWDEVQKERLMYSYVVSVLQESYGDKFDRGKLDKPDISKVFILQAGGEQAVVLMRNLRIYAIGGSLILIKELLTDIIQHSPSLWATVDYEADKVIALSNLVGLRILRDQGVIRRILDYNGGPKYRSGYEFLSTPLGYPAFRAKMKKQPHIRDYPQLMLIS